MKVCLDPGHGGKDEGTQGTRISEKSITLLLALLFGNILIRNGVDVIFTRKDDKYIGLQDRCNIANKNKCDYFISFHCNNSSDPMDSGSEIFCQHPGGVSESLANALLKTLADLNKNQALKVKEGEFHVLKNTSMPAILIQIMYLSNPEEESKLMDPVWQRLCADELSRSFLIFTGLKSEKDYQRDTSYKVSILGDSLSTVEELENYVHRMNPDAPYLAKLYVNIGKEEGIRGDIAFTQALIETDYLNSSVYNSKAYNYISLRSPNSNDNIAEFKDPSEGIRAHIQHLKAYASTEGINTRLVDPIFHLVPRGSVANWEDLDNQWFLPRADYGKNIIDLWKKIMKLSTSQEKVTDNLYDQWKNKGLLPEGIDFEKPVTWGEFIQVLNKLINKE